MWGTPGEPGWGMQINDQGTIPYVTLFVYNAAGQPTFYATYLTHPSDAVWTGDLFETHGPYFGSALYDVSTPSTAQASAKT